eukprot:g6511.t1
MLKARLPLAVALLGVLTAGSFNNSSRPVVEVAGGRLRGVRTAGTSAYFLGVPYAAPPVGAARWLPPQPVLPWTGELEASAFKPQCAQLHDWSGRAGEGSEDCLYLDVYAPSIADGDAVQSPPPRAAPRVPGSMRFNGTYMARAQHVVVISVNYRLGILGFLGSKQLATRPGGDGGTGNYGVQDQRAAMAWARANAGAFGGDPDRIMIHGCSAGGVSIANHLASPRSWPHFHAAGMESGNHLTFTDAVPMGDAQHAFDAVLAEFGCADAACLLRVNASALLRSRSFYHAAPVVDGVNLADFPRALLAAGGVARVPTIVGSTRDELAGLEAAALARFANLSQAGFEAWLAANYGEQHVARLVALYPASAEVRVDPWGRGDCAGAAAGSGGCSVWYYLVQTIATDDAIVCPARNVAQLLPKGLAYQYSWEFPISPDGVEPNNVTTNFAGHCSQNPYDFGNEARAAAVGGGAPGMASLMSAAWARLARGGAPGSGAAPWPAYDNETDASFRFGTSAAASGMHANKRAQCDFLRWCRGSRAGHSPLGSTPQLCTPSSPSSPTPPPLLSLSLSPLV